VPGWRHGKWQVAGLRPFAVTSPAPVDAWEEVLATAPQALPSQTPVWLRCVCAVGGYEDATRLYQTDDGRRLVLPLVRRTRLGRIFSAEASLPTGWGPAGLLGERGVVLPDDVRMVFADLGHHRAHARVVAPRSGNGFELGRRKSGLGGAPAPDGRRPSPRRGFRRGLAYPVPERHPEPGTPRGAGRRHRRA